jgi:primosomal protein N' (replication factor Y) (superfamily II helicase)
MAIAKVEPLLSTRNVAGPFDYRLPETMSGVGVGSVLIVPFGRRRTLGVVVGVAESSELAPERLAEPLELLEAGVPAELVELGSWVGEEYCSTPARGLGLALPPGIGTGADARRVRPLLELEVELTEAGCGAAPLGEAEGGRLGVRQRAVLRALASGAATATRLAASAGAERATIRRLEARGLVRTRQVERRRRPRAVAVGAVAWPVELSSAQRAAVSRIVAAIDAGGRRTRTPALLLHGVTGSGKTEVYMEAVAAALERGRGAIVLVPEIALTPQIVSRFARRFGDEVAVLHSRMPAGARYDEWRRLRSGAARICVGPRSASFAPMESLGLVVIDEEHDPSYKQEGDPRYDAREVAARRAELAGAALVAGSATPRPESWHRLERLELPERVDGLELPAVGVLDMRGRRGPLHPRTAEALAEVAAQGGKAILLINRRGWSVHLVCRSCGHAWRCPDCDVSLVLHRSAEALRCHHCGHLERAPGRCPECDSVTIARVGSGTQRIEAELEVLLQGQPVFRLDSDAAATAGHDRVLAEFDRAPSGVLVGTQMVAKGHDFPEVTLSVVLDADAALRLPDFRAEERTFSLITQLAGRSGRGDGGGAVIVQALAPEARAIRHAASHDAAGFLAGELERREALRYPPFSHLVEVVLSGGQEAALDRAAESAREALAVRLPGGAELLGPAPLFRLRGKHRRRLLLKAPERREVVAAVGAAVGELTARRRLREVAISVDVDPQ